MATLPISLIIASRDRPALLREAVASVLAGDAVPAELLVVDQSQRPQPTLAALGAARGTEVRYTWSPGAGVSRARNAGVAAARCDVLAFTDDDMRATPSWLEELARALDGAGVDAVVTGQVRPTEAEAPGRFAPSLKTDEQAAVYAGPVDQDVLYTGNMALHRATFAAVGGFDKRLGPGTRFPAAEDNDLARRLLRAGYRIHYAPMAVLFHRAWRDRRAYGPLQWQYGRGQGAFFAKHLTLGDLSMLRRLRRTLARRTRTCLSAVRRGDRQAAQAEAAYLLGVLTGVAEWLLTRPETR